MLDIHGMGRAGGRPSASAGRKPAQGGANFEAMMTRTAQDARPAAEPAPAGRTLADRCRKLLEGADEAGASLEEFRALHGRLLKATEAEYGHLAHDDLARILAMADYAERTEDVI